MEWDEEADEPNSENTDEIEEVLSTVVEIEDSEIKQPQAQVSELPDAIGNKVCLLCKEQNLIAELHVQNCGRCGDIYCTHFASSVDPMYCSDCNHQIQLIDQTFVRTDTVLSEDGFTQHKKTSKARQLIFSGLDWLFFQRKISTLSDQELALAVEYHHTIYHSMLSEREKRRVEYAHRFAGKIPIRISTGTVDTTESKSSVVKHTRVTKAVKQDKVEVQLKSALEALLKSGLTPEDIAKMFK